MTLWNVQAVTAAINNRNIEWHRHALERMMERGISRRNVMDVLITGEVIEEYPSDMPYPSALIFGVPDETPLHIVAAFDHEQGILFIITAYFPDSLHFLDDYKTRRK